MPTQFQLQLQMGDKTYKSKGPTIADAIEKLPFEGFVKTKALLTVKYGKLKAQKLMFVPMMKRVLFGSRLFKEVFSKQLLTIMR